MTIKGYAGQLKGEQKHVTIAPLGSGKHGLDVLPKALFEISSIPVTPVSSELKDYFDETGLKTQKQIIEITAHGMKEGDVLRFDTGPLVNIEATVIDVEDANTLILGDEIPDATTSTCLKMRPVTLTIDSSGNLAVSSTPVKIVLDGVDTEVGKDTVTPANTVAMPVEIVSAAGGVEATFNVTTGDLNIAQTHDAVPAVFDSTRIGDGTNLMAVNAALEATVRDGDAITELVAIKGLDFATQTTLAALLTELQLKANLTETQPVSAASLPLPTGAATEAKQDAAILEQTNFHARAESFDLDLSAGAGSVEDVLGASLRISQNGGSIEAKGQQASADSIPVVISSDQSAINVNNISGAVSLPTGASTEAKQDTTISTLGDISLQLPASIGIKADAASLSVTQSTEDRIVTASIDSSLTAIQTAIENMDTGLSVVDQLDTPLFDASSTQINGNAGAFVEVVASTAEDVKKLDIIDDIGEFIGIYTGAAASEVLHAVTKLGGGELEVNIPSGTRISIRNMKAAAITNGNMAINLLG